jgi:starch synthase
VGLNILIVASECVPFAKTGGLADVVGILPKFLKKMGHDVRVVMPRYYRIDKTKLKPLVDAMSLGIPMDIIGEQWCGVYEGVLPDSDVPIYFLEHELYYGRDAIYNNAEGEGFLDNDNRFVFLSRAALQLVKALDFKPDVVHANDWHTAATPVFMNTIYKHDPFFANSASVLTIHNMQYQGQFYEGLMDVLAVGWEHFNFLELEQDDCVNLLKGGIYHANLVNTVSEGYKNEIMTTEYSYGLDGVMRDRAAFVRGILNGMDYEEWNPKTDKYLAKNYDFGDMDGKDACKTDIQTLMGLPVNQAIPLFGIVSRLVEQKGVHLLSEAFDWIMGLDIQMVMLGEGDACAHEFFRSMASKYPTKFAVQIGYDNALAHKIEAGADFFVMPSIFEPCGLNQMYSLRYGTLPIVRATGGLDDTIENFDERRKSGDGFKFGDAKAWALYNTIGWATYTYYNNKEAMAILQKNAMSKRFTWEESAKKYEEMYVEAIRLKRD